MSKNQNDNIDDLKEELKEQKEEIQEQKEELQDQREELLEQKEELLEQKAAIRDMELYDSQPVTKGKSNKKNNKFKDVSAMNFLKVLLIINLVISSLCAVGIVYLISKEKNNSVQINRDGGFRINNGQMGPGQGEAPEFRKQQP